MSGDSLLHYRILEKIGAGGMGVVYKALDTRLDRPVAIKTLPYIDDPKHRHQFIWEARATARLRHPNIVVLYDVASQQDREFIVMEYIPGAALSERLARGPLPMEESTTVCEGDRLGPGDGARGGHRPSRSEAFQRPDHPGGLD